MKTTKSLIAAAAVVLGLGGGAAAYQLASTGESTVQPVSQTVSEDSEGPAAPSISGGTHFRWAPCKAPAVREGKVCVTHVVHAVVLPGATTPAGATSNNSGGGGGGDHADHPGEDADEPSDDPSEDTEPGDDDDGDDDEPEPGDD
jgi:hypothetical protein